MRDRVYSWPELFGPPAHSCGWHQQRSQSKTHRARADGVGSTERRPARAAAGATF